MEIDKDKQKQMAKLYKRAEKITSQENITDKDMEELNRIADTLIENYAYVDLELFNRLPYNNDIIRAKVDAAIHKFKIILEVFLDFTNFGKNGRLDKLRKYYSEQGKDEQLKVLNEMAGDESRGRKH